jgi:RecA-family ATPase
MAGLSLAGRPVEDQPWHVADLIPARTVTLLGGDGGAGKSLLALHLAVATATGRRWIGRETAGGGALFLTAEDDDPTLHRRLARILDAEGLGFEDLDRLTLRSLAGEEALLAAPDRAGVLRTTALYEELEARLRDEAPALVVLDTAADLHAGNENDRCQVRQFVGLLRGLAIRHECAVVLLAHPSRAGMAAGDGLSGSTAWNGSVRSRLCLERVADDGASPNPDARRLSVKKSNYGPCGGEIGLTLRDGVFVADAPEAGGGRLDRLAGNAKAERVFLKLLRLFAEQGRHVSPTPSVSYAPTVFAKHPEAEGMTKRALAAAMENLLTAGRIVVAEHGEPSARRQHLAERGSL